MKESPNLLPIIHEKWKGRKEKWEKWEQLTCHRNDVMYIQIIQTKKMKEKKEKKKSLFLIFCFFFFQKSHEKIQHNRKLFSIKKVMMIELDWWNDFFFSLLLDANELEWWTMCDLCDDIIIWQWSRTTRTHCRKERRDSRETESCFSSLETQWD